MQTVQLSEQGKIQLPEAICKTHHWEAGIELMVIETKDGVLLKPKSPNAIQADNDLALINQHAAELNDEAADVLEYQVDK